MTKSFKGWFPECSAILTIFLRHGQKPSSLRSAEPHSSVGSLRTGGCWFNPRLSQYSFRGLMVAIATEFIVVSLLSKQA